MKRFSRCLLVVSMLVPSVEFAVRIGLYAATDCASCNLVLGLTEGTGTFVIAVTDVVSDRRRVADLDASARAVSLRSGSLAAIRTWGALG